MTELLPRSSSVSCLAVLHAIADEIVFRAVAVVIVALGVIAALWKRG